MSEPRWIEIAKELPAIDEVVVCTDGTRRWLDKRTPLLSEVTDLHWQGHKPTHWHPLAALPVMPDPVGGAPK